MRKLLDRKIVAQNGICGICKEKFTDYSDVVPIISAPVAWAAPGATIIPTTFRPCTGGATARRDQRTSEDGYQPVMAIVGELEARWFIETINAQQNMNLDIAK
jgi:hypothetical protein